MKELTKAQRKKLMKEIDKKSIELGNDTASKVSELLNELSASTTNILDLVVTCQRSGKTFRGSVDLAHMFQYSDCGITEIGFETPWLHAMENEGAA